MTILELPALNLEHVSTNREAWLEAVGQRIIRDILTPKGYGNHADIAQESPDGDEETIPVSLLEKTRYSCSWPSVRATSRNRAIGQCWAGSASVTSECNIFVSPTLGDAYEAAETLTHELMHAAVGTKHGHDRHFAAACAKVGFEGKPTENKAGPQLEAQLAYLLTAFPPYPHGRIEAAPKLKSEKGRMLKVYCKNEACPTQAVKDGPFKFRLTRVWVTEFAAGEDAEGDVRVIMQCPGCNTALAVELPVEENEGADE